MSLSFGLKSINFKAYLNEYSFSLLRFAECA